MPGNRKRPLGDSNTIANIESMSISRQAARRSRAHVTHNVSAKDRPEWACRDVLRGACTFAQPGAGPERSHLGEVRTRRADVPIRTGHTKSEARLARRAQERERGARAVQLVRAGRIARRASVLDQH